MTSLIARPAIASLPIVTLSSEKVMIPEWSSPKPSSRAEQIIPLEVFPYVSRAPILKSPGKTAPGRAATTQSPTLKLEAPQMTKRTSFSPQSSPTYLTGFLNSVSSSIDKTFAKTSGPDRSAPCVMISSTSNPTRISASEIASAEIVGGTSTNSFIHDSGARI